MKTLRPLLVRWLLVVVPGVLVVFLTVRFNLATAPISPILPYFLYVLIFPPPLEAAAGFVIAISYGTYQYAISPHAAAITLSIRLALLFFFAWLIYYIKRRLAQRTRALQAAHNALRIEAQRQTSLAELTARLGSAHTQQEALDLAVRAACAMLDTPAGAAYVPHAAGGLEMPAYEGLRPPAPGPIALPLEGSAAGEALRTGTMQAVNDVQHATNIVVPFLKEGGAAQAALVAPLTNNNERPFGVLEVYHHTPRVWTESEHNLLRILATSATLAMAAARERETYRSNAQRLGAILDVMPSATIVIDTEGTIQQVNRHTEQLFCYERGELEGQAIETLVPEPQRPLHTAARIAYLQDPHELHRDAQGQRKDGGVFPVEIGLAPLTMNGDVMIISTVIDLTERMAATAALEQANLALAQANIVKDQFLATMSHEIRTPMNGVIGMTGLLLDTSLTAEQREYAEVVRTSGEALMVVINDILDFSKIEAGHLELEDMILSPRRCMEEAIDFFAAQARTKGLELGGLVDADVPELLKGDAGRLRQVFANLISNAVKFTPDGEVTARLHWYAQEGAGTFLRGEVHDTGIGISSEVQSQLFLPFAQADSSTTRRYGGTGLGLAICRRLVTLMGGEIGVESTLGEGSTFWFTVRLGTLSAGESAELAPPADLRGNKVLVVDDNETNRRIVHYQVTNWGMSNGMVSSGAAALAVLRTSAETGHPYDLVVLDLDMPVMDGLELARQVRADPLIARTKLVMLSSLVPQRTREHWQDLLDAHITKPVRQSQLYDALAHALGQQVAPTPAPLTATTPLYHGRGRVLVAEDNPVNQHVAVRMLERLGYQADAVADGAEAVAALERAQYDLVLMDCLMPILDGYEATGAIRRLEGLGRLHTSHTTIVAMTALAFSGDAEKCIAAGMDDYIPKPVTLTHLAAVLSRWTMTTGADGTQEPIPHAEITMTPSPPLDVATLEALATDLGGSDALRTVAALYRQDTDNLAGKLGAALETQDAVGFTRLIHGYKGSSRHIGAENAAALAQQLEDYGHAGDLAGAATLLPAVLAAAQEAARALECYVQGHPGGSS